MTDCSLAKMFRSCIFIILFTLCHCQVVDEKGHDPVSNGKTAAPGPKQWKLAVNIYMAKHLPQVVRRNAGTTVKLQCEAVLNFTRVTLASEEKSIKDVPTYHINSFVRNVKIIWYKENNILVNSSRVTIKNNTSDSVISSILRIRGLQKSDESNYSCMIVNPSYVTRSVTKLIIQNPAKEDDFSPTENSPSHPSTRLQATVSGLELEVVDTTTTAKPTSKEIPNPDPICQEYTGDVCSLHLKGQYVYIPHTTSQIILEQKLFRAIQVTKYSNEISRNCEGYALPSLCYSTFPICREPSDMNNNFTRDSNLLWSFVKLNEKARHNVTNPGFVNLHNLPNHSKDLIISQDYSLTYDQAYNISSITFNYRQNSTLLRRVCKGDCEILENELCQREYAIAKWHPDIGKQLTLEQCDDLPEEDPDCLSIGVETLSGTIGEDDCYWDNGLGYKGRVDTSAEGLSCVPWSLQLKVRLYEHPELAGRHNYCRNPGGMKSKPWCVVEMNSTHRMIHTEQECDIPKCAHKLWIYMIILFIVLISIVMGFIICACRKSKSKEATAMRDINLPNADKNIYGNSRLNSPIEMSDLLNNHNPANPTQNRVPRGNGILRIPQYSLSQIRFLEELGEGAFGKVYKGSVTRNGETSFVAVKALKENASNKTKQDFKREIELISELRHENIVCIVGIALKEEPLCMLFEFMARGDLHEFLMGRAPPQGKGLPAIRLLSISHHIACGMQYLASHHYVHRDLAARNCLVSDDFVVKISDFGLSRDIYSSDYYRVQSKSLLPVRWMPPESILYGKFTTESDVWSYGVVLWEIYSFGLQPYYGYSNQEVIGKVRGGEVLACPAPCPPPLYRLMRDCWRHAPQRRPHFHDIALRLQGWIERGGCPEGEFPELVEAGAGAGGQERAPLLGGCSAAGGMLPCTGAGSASLRRVPRARHDDARSVCSEVGAHTHAPPPLALHRSSASLVEPPCAAPCAAPTRDTVIRIHGAAATAATAATAVHTNDI